MDKAQPSRTPERTSNVVVAKGGVLTQVVVCSKKAWISRANLQGLPSLLIIRHSDPRSTESRVISNSMKQALALLDYLTEIEDLVNATISVFLVNGSGTAVLQTVGAMTTAVRLYISAARSSSAIALLFINQFVVLANSSAVDRHHCRSRPAQLPGSPGRWFLAGSEVGDLGGPINFFRSVFLLLPPLAAAFSVFSGKTLQYAILSLLQT